MPGQPILRPGEKSLGVVSGHWSSPYPEKFLGGAGDVVLTPDRVLWTMKRTVWKSLAWDEVEYVEAWPLYGKRMLLIVQDRAGSPPWRVLARGGAYPRLYLALRDAGLTCTNEIDRRWELRPASPS